MASSFSLASLPLELVARQQVAHRLLLVLLALRLLLGSPQVDLCFPVLVEPLDLSSQVSPELYLMPLP